MTRAYSWEFLERIGAYAAGELSSEEFRKAERFILEDAESQRLAEAHARVLTLLRAIGAESPDPPEALMSGAILWAANKARNERTRRSRLAKDE